MIIRQPSIEIILQTIRTQYDHSGCTRLAAVVLKDAIEEIKKRINVEDNVLFLLSTRGSLFLNVFGLEAELVLNELEIKLEWIDKDNVKIVISSESLT